MKFRYYQKYGSSLISLGSSFLGSGASKSFLSRNFLFLGRPNGAKNLIKSSRDVRSVQTAFSEPIRIFYDCLLKLWFRQGSSSDGPHIVTMLHRATGCSALDGEDWGITSMTHWAAGWHVGQLE